MVEIKARQVPRNLERALLILLILLGMGLRIYELDLVPPGMFYDEAFNAIQARNVEQGTDRPIFFTGNGGEEPLPLYVAAGVFAIAGPGVWALRLSAALLDLLIIPGLYACAKLLFPSRGLAPVVAAFVGATIYWIVNMSRVGWPTEALAVGVTLSTASLLLAARTRRVGWAIVAGLVLGLTLYTYPGARAWPIALAVTAVYLLVLHRPWLQARLRIGAVAAVIALLVVAPLALYFLSNPGAFTGKIEQVAQANSPVQNLVRIAGMFSLAGDIDPRDNLSGRPALDLFLSLLFIIGLIVSATRWRSRSYAFLLIWLLVMTLPSALTIYAPNFRRTVGAMPAVALLCGVGADWLWSQRAGLQLIHAGWFGSRGYQGLFAALLLLGFGFSLWSGVDAYWNRWAKDPQLYYAFDEGLQDLGKELAARPLDNRLYISPDYQSHPTVEWEMSGRSFSSFDGRQALVLPAPAQTATFGIITQQDPDTLPRLLQLYPDARTELVLKDRQGEEYARVLTIPAGSIAAISPGYPVNARIGGFCELVGYDLARTGSVLQLTTYWRALAATPEDYTVFVHALGPAAPDGGPVLATADQQPGGGTYPTSRWRTGETIVDRYDLDLHDVPSGGLKIEMGMYLLSTGARLPVFVGGLRAPGDRLLISPPG